ncbi:hypothetical protein KCH_67330 [Kitasatospora cheerisanensis KCTC 2395]|uniref:Uncharacterized protein n=1 Tax=Kitasatospora cheerisanensis KCTC 2395 TaxID=1348663 RepID=A0A066YU84_9ACTN|nr:hypothetical protein KCH_67330 [Kitasatospora cheerisanensis KCTC 2395]
MDPRAGPTRPGNRPARRRACAVACGCSAWPRPGDASFTPLLLPPPTPGRFVKVLPRGSWPS